MLLLSRSKRWPDNQQKAWHQSLHPFARSFKGSFLFLIPLVYVSCTLVLWSCISYQCFMFFVRCDLHFTASKSQLQISKASPVHIGSRGWLNLSWKVVQKKGAWDSGKWSPRCKGSWSFQEKNTMKKIWKYGTEWKGSKKAKTMCSPVEVSASGFEMRSVTASSPMVRPSSWRSSD